MNSNSGRVNVTYENRFGNNNIIAKHNAVMVNTKIPLNTLNGLQLLNSTISPEQVTAIDAIVARVAFEMPVKYWNRYTAIAFKINMIPAGKAFFNKFEINLPLIML